MVHSCATIGNVPAMVSVPTGNRLQAELNAHPEERLHLALEAGGFGVWEWDIGSGLLTWSQQVYEFFELSPSEYRPTFESFGKLVHPEDRETVQASIARTLDTDEPYRVLFRTLQAKRWLEGWGQLVRDSTGNAVGMIGLVADATQRVASEQERAELLNRERAARSSAEAGRRRLSYLAQAFKVIGASLDVETTTERVLRVLVPHVGDWAAVCLEQEGRTAPVGVAQRSRKRQATMHTLEDADPIDEKGAVAEAMRSGQPRLQSRIPDDLSLRTPFDVVEVQSLLIVPLMHRRRAVGAIAVGDAERSYQSGDVELVEQIADRAAIAFRNATLFEERSSIARVLQRSLLPAALPTMEGLEVAGGYASAGSGLHVGGDFYDLFQIDADRFGFAIGDVSGKGHEAAATTALTRHTIRATALLRDHPSGVLDAVNDVLLEHGPDDRFCTAVYGVIRPISSGAEITLGVAGHVPPMVARSTGTIEEISGTGVLLGMYPETMFDDLTFTLAPGDTLVLYTDGLTDVKVGGTVLGRDWIHEELVIAHKQPVAEIVRTLERNAVRAGGTLTDDLAILAVQVPGRD